jgi:dienelactone hydrolase
VAVAGIICLGAPLAWVSPLEAGPVEGAPARVATPYTGAATPAESPVRIVTPRGAAVEIIEERPASAGPFPALVLAAGAGYDMRQPILEHVAHALAGAGIAVFRFDWAYRVADAEHGRPSADRAAEIEDLTTVLARARKAPWVDPRRIAVGGKSLGSIIAWRVLRQTPDVKGALLLTPVCNPKPPPSPKLPEGNYPDVGAETRPSAWILGKTDPVCAPAVLYKYLAAAGGSAQVSVVRGDHAFEEGPSSDARNAAGNAQSLELVTRLATDFAASLLAGPRADATPTAPRVFLVSASRTAKSAARAAQK